jgi:thiol-disulfide isomerase/thioredoxin
MKLKSPPAQTQAQPATDDSMPRQRRRLLTATCMLGAAGLGVAAHQCFGEAKPGASAASTKAADLLFAANLNDPDGKPQALAQWKGRPLVLNFWATWCVPCVEEMPDLQALREVYLPRKLEVLGLAIDNAKAVQEFRQRLGIRYPLLVAGSGGTELARALGNNSGGLPHTVLLDASGAVRYSHLGRIKIAELKQAIETALA